MMHKPSDLLPPPQIPDLDDLVRATRREPLAALRGCSDSLDTRHMRGEDEQRLQVELVLPRQPKGKIKDLVL